MIELFETLVEIVGLQKVILAMGIVSVFYVLSLILLIVLAKSIMKLRKGE